MSGGRRAACLAAVGALLVLAGGTLAQVSQQWRGWRSRVEPREGMPERRSGFTFCRLRFESVRREPGGQGWSTDYPMSDRNFMTRLSQLTRAGISRWEDGEPGHAVVRATDPELFLCPFLFASDVGTLRFSDAEVERLREYLLKGGFLWADDFWGERAWAQWTREIRRVLPELEVVELGPEHPLLSIYYDVSHVPQVPSIQFWYRSGGLTSERGRESLEPRMSALFDDRNRMLVLMSHDTDIADGWEREGDDEDFFYAFSPAAYAVGINVVLWAMSAWRSDVAGVPGSGVDTPTTLPPSR